MLSSLLAQVPAQPYWPNGFNHLSLQPSINSISNRSSFSHLFCEQSASVPKKWVGSVRVSNSSEKTGKKEELLWDVNNGCSYRDVCECCYSDLFLFFFIRTGLYFHIKRTPSTGTKRSYHWRWSLLCWGKVLAKVALNAASHSVSPCTNRGEGNKPDWTKTGDSSWYAFRILPCPFEMLPIVSLPSQMGVWVKAKGFWETSQLRHFKSFAAKAKDDDKSLKIKVECWFSPSSLLFFSPCWMNLLCFWGQKGNNIQPTCAIYA